MRWIAAPVSRLQRRPVMDFLDSVSDYADSWGTLLTDSPPEQFHGAHKAAPSVRNNLDEDDVKENCKANKRADEAEGWRRMFYAGMY
jgi:hypothetical protein